MVDITAKNRRRVTHLAIGNRTQKTRILLRSLYIPLIFRLLPRDFGSTSSFPNGRLFDFCGVGTFRGETVDERYGGCGYHGFEHVACPFSAGLDGGSTVVIVVVLVDVIVRGRSRDFFAAVVVIIEFDGGESQRGWLWDMEKSGTVVIQQGRRERGACPR